MPNAKQLTTMADKVSMETAFGNMVAINTNFQVDMKNVFKVMQLADLQQTMQYLKHDRTTMEKTLVKLCGCVGQMQNLQFTKVIKIRKGV